MRFLFFFSFLSSSCWQFLILLDSWLSGVFLEWLRHQGTKTLILTVSQIDPWVTTVKNLHGLNDISIEEIKARYDPGLLVLRKINSLSISGLSTNLDFEQRP